MNKYLDFVSYNLWSLFSPPVGREGFHCHRKRGYTKARKKEPQVQAILTQNTPVQQIGILAQAVVYEFFHNPELLNSPNGKEEIANLLNLDRELDEVRERVIKIIENYYSAPFLPGKNIFLLMRGDEGFPKPILIHQGNYQFNLFAAMDCIIIEPDGRFNILDFKTGTSDFDRRQALVYLLAARYLYPEKKAIASFYNLETQKKSENIEANNLQLDAVRAELTKIAQKHQEELRKFRCNLISFQDIYPESPGIQCKSCDFNSICEFALSEFS